MTATPVGVERVAERHAAGRGDRVDDRPGVDVEELHPAELAGADVAGDGGLVGEEGPLVVLLGQRPPEGDAGPVCSGGHGSSVANMCSSIQGVLRIVDALTRAAAVGVSAEGRPAGTSL